MLTEAISSRQPLGWGPYLIDEWTPGDHISLSKNPAYFRAGTGLPAFDHLAFRFIPTGDEALAALLAGECDVLDKTALSEEQNTALDELLRDGKLAVVYENGSAWEHADFGIATLSQTTPSLFQTREMRQAIAQCIDRESLVATLFPGQSQVPATYLHLKHPFYNPEVPLRRKSKERKDRCHDDHEGSKGNIQLGAGSNQKTKHHGRQGTFNTA